MNIKKTELYENEYIVDEYIYNKDVSYIIVWSVKLKYPRKQWCGGELFKCRYWVCSRVSSRREKENILKLIWKEDLLKLSLKQKKELYIKYNELLQDKFTKKL